MNGQIKPFYVGHKRGKLSYGIRSHGAISLKDNRPWYGGWFWINGQNTNFLWDKEGRYMRKSYGFRRVKGRLS